MPSPGRIADLLTWMLIGAVGLVGGGILQAVLRYNGFTLAKRAVLQVAMAGVGMYLAEEVPLPWLFLTGTGVLGLAEDLLIDLFRLLVFHAIGWHWASLLVGLLGAGCVGVAILLYQRFHAAREKKR